MSTRSFAAAVFLLLAGALTACAPVTTVREQAPPAPAGPATVAVWDLENLSPVAAIQLDLGELLSGQVVEGIREKSDYTIVERERLVLVLEELNLGSSALADEETRLRLGKLLGAPIMVFGGYQVIADSMRLDLRLIDVETGKVLKAVEKTTGAGDLPAWLRAAREAAEELVQ